MANCGPGSPWKVRNDTPFRGGKMSLMQATALSTNTEYDFTLDYRFTANYWPDYLAPLWLRARAVLVDQRLGSFTSLTTDYRVILNYQWVFKYK